MFQGCVLSLLWGFHCVVDNFAGTVDFSGVNVGDDGDKIQKREES